MSSKLNALDRAIIRAIKANEDIYEIVGEEIHRLQAPDNSAYPVIVFQRLSMGEDLRTFDSKYAEESWVLIKAAALGDNGADEAGQLIDMIDAVFDDWQGEEDLEIIYCRREQHGDDDAIYRNSENEFMGSALYRILVRI